MDSVSQSRQSLAERAMANPSMASRAVVLTMLLLVTSFIIWASFFDIDIRVKGTGKVIPTSKLQEIQHFEGGVIREILISEGDIVDSGQPLVRLNPKRAQQELGEAEATTDGLQASIIRLQAEVNGVEPSYPQSLQLTSPEFIASEEKLRQIRQQHLDIQTTVLKRQLGQKQAEENGYKKRLPNLNHSLKLLQQEIGFKQKLIEQNAAAPIELLALQREEADIRERIYSTEQQQSVASQNIAEIRARIKEQRSGFKADAREQLAEKLVRLEALQGNVVATQDAVNRTAVIAPVRGIIKTLVETTIGGVVRSGETIIELVPLDESLLIEAQVSPADIAHLEPGLEANVRLSAFDSMVTGGLKGKVERISPDSQQDEKTGRTYYRVYVRTDESSIPGPRGTMQILPGMEADVDILTGRRTVMDYLLKPMIRGLSSALVEK